MNSRDAGEGQLPQRACTGSSARCECDILLVYPPVMQKFAPTDPPFGQMYLASVLRQAGLSVQMLDLNALRWPPEKVEAYFQDHRYPIVGVGGMTTVYPYVKWLAGLIRRISPQTRLLGGGSMATPVPELVLSNTELDIVCISESECTIVPLVRELLNGGRIDNIEGIAFKDADGAIRRSPSRPRILNLDDLPYPAYDLVDIKLYMGNVGKRPSLMEDAKRRGYDPSKVSSPFIMFSSRGCPFSCTFCYRNFGRQVTRHSVDYMIKHILHVHERYSANNIAFYDETFNSDRKWMLEFCERAKRELPGMHFWIGGARVDLLDESMVKALYDAGVYEVSVGVESFDDRILQAIGKRFDAQTLRRGIELLKQYGVAPSCMGMLYGFPEDDERSLQVSQAAIIELGIPAYFQFPVPFPGTDLYAALRSSGRLQDEEQFMLDLGDRMTQDLFINLSRFDDKTLVDMVRSAEETIAKAIAPPVEPPKPLSLYRRVRNLAGRILRRATS